MLVLMLTCFLVPLLRYGGGSVGQARIWKLLGILTLLGGRKLADKSALCIGITLVDEEDDKFCMLYQPSKAALSTGWGGFVVDHKLLDGDCLVFQLIERTMFKVYIIRAASYLKASTDEASSF
ncbi:hypothetical protein BDA96_03G221600 [Sorghum bicolor]|uniref:TF-B3 domain-containing protein n=2 Tax=Sorghum bicolor TaxID=4558 RepID=A0A921RG24_SORBI|nr:hypothetical protein BDA96_03G221400 [Sorghum bicolor]KAG0538277.1 hypothetical protein BDA96_03G221600 [Sorghum bicolor]OQU75568.1 hypothetical protein SORBI_3K044414 [Sorghum bicolor]